MFTIVGTIGSIDDLIEKNNGIAAKTLNHALVTFDFAFSQVKTVKLHSLIKFLKGKKPEFVDKKAGKPYLTIDLLTGSDETTYSSTGVDSNECDVLMVMDGASSGKVFIGFNGYVGSTLAKLKTSIDSVLVYLFLYKHQQNAMDNTTGSAIPHADKGFIGELDMPMVTNEIVIRQLKNELGIISKLRKENNLLQEQKRIILSKYF